MILRRRGAALVAALTMCLAGGAIAVTTTASAASCTVAGAGDIGQVADGPQHQTGDAIRALAPDAVFTLGDNAQIDGAPSEYTDLYDPYWGSFKAITHPAPGNHDYNAGSPNGSSYFAYFGLNPNTQRYYAWDLCGWRLYSLNAELTGADKATEVSWFATDLAAHSGVPAVAYWHQPRWSDVASNGPDPEQQDLWAAAVAGGVKVVMNGHEHAYERFAPMNASGQPTTPGSGTGTREFIAGTGGARLKGFNATPSAASQKRISGHGILALTLRATGYDWRWTGTDVTETDAGSENWGTSTSTTSSTTTSSSSTPPASGPSFVGATSYASPATSTLTGDRPAGVAAGDVLLASLAVDNAPTLTAPSGWTRLSIMPLRPSGVTVDAFYRIATAGEPGSYTWALSSAQKGSVGITAFRGVGAPRAVSRALGSGGSISVGGLSATAGEVVVGGLGQDTKNSQITPPSGWTQAFATMGEGQVDEQAYRVGPASGAFIWAMSNTVPAGAWAAVLPVASAPSPKPTPSTTTSSTTSSSTTSSSTTTTTTATSTSASTTSTSSSVCAPVTVTVTKTV